MRYILILLIALFAGTPAYSQNDGMMQGKRKQKRIWRKWGRKKGKGDHPYNPYLKNLKTEKAISNRLAKGQKREIRRQRREYKKQLKRGKKKISE
jgi:hypothetical protein